MTVKFQKNANYKSQINPQVGADLQSEPCFAKTKDIIVFSHLFNFSFLS